MLSQAEATYKIVGFFFVGLFVCFLRNGRDLLVKIV